MFPSEDESYGLPDVLTDCLRHQISSMALASLALIAIQPCACPTVFETILSAWPCKRFNKTDTPTPNRKQCHQLFRDFFDVLGRAHCFHFGVHAGVSKASIVNYLRKDVSDDLYNLLLTCLSSKSITVIPNASMNVSSTPTSIATFCCSLTCGIGLSIIFFSSSKVKPPYTVGVALCVSTNSCSSSPETPRSFLSHQQLLFLESHPSHQLFHRVSG